MTNIELQDNIFTTLVDEFAPIIIISFIGSLIHEYAFKSPTEFTLRNTQLWITTIFSSIICYAIDPFVLNFHHRLIYLPPLILGLVGMDLIQSLSTVKGNLSLIEFILGFVGIVRKNHTESNIPQTQSYDDIEHLLTVFFSLISSVLIEYHNDTSEFLKKYHLIKKDFYLLENELLKHESIPLPLTILFGNIIQKMLEMDLLYKKLTNDK